MQNVLLDVEPATIASRKRREKLFSYKVTQPSHVSSWVLSYVGHSVQYDINQTFYSEERET
jgi:hypothetical protein